MHWHYLKALSSKRTVFLRELTSAKGMLLLYFERLKTPKNSRW
jgi:hypothetical protein